MKKNERGLVEISKDSNKEATDDYLSNFDSYLMSNENLCLLPLDEKQKSDELLKIVNDAVDKSFMRDFKIDNCEDGIVAASYTNWKNRKCSFSVMKIESFNVYVVSGKEITSGMQEFCDSKTLCGILRFGLVY